MDLSYNMDPFYNVKDCVWGNEGTPQIINWHCHFCGIVNHTCLTINEKKVNGNCLKVKDKKVCPRCGRPPTKHGSHYLSVETCDEWGYIIK